MTVVAQNDPLPARGGAEVRIEITDEEQRLLRKAAELQGWTIAEYIRAALLDRAERDLYEYAARADWETVFPATSSEPLTTLMTAFSDT